MSSQSIINRNSTPNFSKYKKSKRMKKKKIIYKEEYNYVKHLIRNATIGHNWSIKKPKRLGYILVESWSNQGVQMCSGRCIWAYIDPNSGFIYIGNHEEAWKLGFSQKYYNVKYNMQTENDIISLIGTLINPIQ